MRDPLANVPAIGVVWYRSRDYPRILEIMADAHLLPRSYHAWRKQAEEAYAQRARSGVTLVRVYLDPQEFIAWCTSNGHEVDAQGRMAFAARHAMEEHTRRQE